MSFRTFTGALARALASALPASALLAQETEDAPLEVRQISVVVDNLNFLDVRVDLVVSGQRLRLGDVTSYSTAVLTLPEDIPLHDLRLLVDPVGSRAGYLSDQLSVFPGDEVGLTVHNSLPLTALTVL